MFRKVLVIGIIGAFVLSTLAIANAQEKKKNQFGIRVGFVEGMQVIKPDPSEGHGGKSFQPGYLFGMNFERQFRGNLYFSPDVVLVIGHDEFKHEDKEHTGTERKSEFTNYYVIIPLTYKYKFDEKVALPFKPYIIAGPELGYLIKSTQKPYVLSTYGSDAKANFKSATWALTGGAGVSYKMSNSPLVFFGDIRYTRSFQSYNKDNNSLPAGAKVNYSLILLSAGVHF